MFWIAGIYWDMLSPEKLSQIRILRELKRRIEQKTGQPLPYGPSEKLPPTAQRGSKPAKRSSSKNWSRGKWIKKQTCVNLFYSLDSSDVEY